MKTADQVAEILSQALLSTGNVRGRVSRKTVSNTLGVCILRAQDTLDVMQAMYRKGFLMGELARGGFGVISIESLTGAKPFYTDEDDTDFGS